MGTLLVVLAIAAAVALLLSARGPRPFPIQAALDRVLPPEAPRPPYQITPEDEAAVQRIVQVLREAGVKANTQTSHGLFGLNREIHFTDGPPELNPVSSIARLWDRDNAGMISMWTFGGEVDGRIEQEVLALGFKRLSPPGSAPSVFLRS